LEGTVSSDLFLTVGNILTTNDLAHLVIMFFVVCVAGWVMPNLNSIITTTFIALIVFAAASTMATAVLAGDRAIDAIEQDWSRLFGLNTLTLVAYVLSFAIAIAGVNTIRNIMMRS
jgi:hypothetical protein